MLRIWQVAHAGTRLFRANWANRSDCQAFNSHFTDYRKWACSFLFIIRVNLNTNDELIVEESYTTQTPSARSRPICGTQRHVYWERVKLGDRCCLCQDLSEVPRPVGVHHVGRGIFRSALLEGILIGCDTITLSCQLQVPVGDLGPRDHILDGDGTWAHTGRKEVLCG